MYVNSRPNERAQRLTARNGARRRATTRCRRRVDDDDATAMSVGPSTSWLTSGSAHARSRSPGGTPSSQIDARARFVLVASLLAATIEIVTARYCAFGCATARTRHVAIIDVVIVECESPPPPPSRCLLLTARKWRASFQLMPSALIRVVRE